MKFRIDLNLFVHLVDKDHSSNNDHSSNWFHEMLIEFAKDLKIIQKQNQKIMDQLQLHLDALNKIDAATTKAGQAVSVIGDRITNLENTIKNMGLTSDQESQLLTQTQGIGDRATQIADALEQMGKTPENPVPVEPGTGENGGTL